MKSNAEETVATLTGTKANGGCTVDGFLKHAEEVAEYIDNVKRGIPPAGTKPSGPEMEQLPEGQGYGWSVKKPSQTAPWDAEIHVDPIKHPSHYNQGDIECITFIEDQKFEFHEASAIQYIVRARYKGNRIQDMKKAIWYLNRKLELLEKQS